MCADADRFADDFTGWNANVNCCYCGGGTTGGSDGSEQDGNDDGGDEEATGECVDLPGVDSYAADCAYYTNTAHACLSADMWASETWNANDKCCVCGGGGTTGGGDGSEQDGNDDGGDEEATGECQDIAGEDMYGDGCDFYEEKNVCLSA